MVWRSHQTKNHQLLQKEETQMNDENYLLAATEMVEAWELPDSELAEAIQAQAELMAGIEHHWRDS